MMRRMMLIAALSAGVPAFAQRAPVPDRVARIMAATDGQSAATAYRVTSVEDEYAILIALRLRPVTQSLVDGKKPYDVIDAVDESGTKRKLWFDIGSFYPELPWPK